MKKPPIPPEPKTTTVREGGAGPYKLHPDDPTGKNIVNPAYPPDDGTTYPQFNLKQKGNGCGPALRALFILFVVIVITAVLLLLFILILAAP